MSYVQKGSKLYLSDDTINHSDTYYAQDGSSLVLVHYGKQNQKWGKRLYQYKDGSLTPLGKIHYSYQNVQNRREAKAKATKRAKNAKLKAKQQKIAEKEQIKQQKLEEKNKKKTNKEARKNDNHKVDMSEASNDYIRSRTSLHKLTNAEVSATAQRLKNESEINRYLAPKQSFGEKLAKQAFEKFTTATVNSISEAAGKKLAAEVMKKFNQSTRNANA